MLIPAPERKKQKKKQKKINWAISRTLGLRTGETVKVSHNVSSVAAMTKSSSQCRAQLEQTLAKYGVCWSSYYRR